VWAVAIEVALITDGAGPHGLRVGAVAIEVALIADGAGPHGRSESLDGKIPRGAGTGRGVNSVGGGRAECVVAAAVVVVLPGIGDVEVHRVGAARQGAAWCPALFREEAYHCRQLLEESVNVTKAWSGYGSCGLRGRRWAWWVAGLLRWPGGPISVQGMLQLVPGSVGHVPDVREEASGDCNWPGVGGACVRPVCRRRAWGLRGRQRRGRRRKATGGPRVGVGVRASAEDAEINGLSDASGVDACVGTGGGDGAVL